MKSSMAARAIEPEEALGAHHAVANLHLVLQDKVIPSLIASRRPASIQIGPRMVEPRIADLARLLISVEPDSGLDGFAAIEKLYLDCGSLAALCEEVLEPAARRLGDLWAADHCSEVEVSIALGRLQSAMRQLSVDAPGPLSGALVSNAAVLIAPAPGEDHILGTVLDAELLWQAGCNVHCDFPRDLQALQDIVADDWLDVLDLSLSTVYRRQHWLTSLASTIASARRASMNKAIVIVVGGRAFFESRTAFASVGADASCTSASGIVALVSTALHAARAKRQA